MVKKKRRGFGLFDDIFETFFDEMESIFSDVEGFQGGYSISVTQTPEGTVVQAEIDDSINAEEFRKELERRYPGAKIIIRGGKAGKLIERVPQKESEEKENKVTITLKDEEEKTEEEPSILDLIKGKKRPFIVREDE